MEQVRQPSRSTSADTEVGHDEKKGISRISFPSGTSSTPKSNIEIGLKQLINKLNLLNFQGGSLSVVFKHRIYDRTTAVKARPLPCQDRRLICRWEMPVDIDQLSEAFEFQCLYVPKGQQLFEVKAQLKGMDEKQVIFGLPPVSREISERKVIRHPCSDVSVYMFQNGATFYGHLADYGALQFRIDIITAPPQTFRWIDPEEPATIVLVKGQETLYSGDCKIVKQHPGRGAHQLILEPLKRHLRRFSPREFRSKRQKLNPSPDAVFIHPFFAAPVHLKTYDMSGSGFAVEEEKSSTVLLPGMIIPSLELVFNDGKSLSCMVQVVYSRALPETTTVRSGLAILDMAVQEHTQLLALLQHAEDTNIYISKKVDLENLWDFFFETGFIYPAKYKFIESHKAEIKSTYEKIYSQCPGIASHFIYQDRGRVLAHMAMVRFYDKAWLIHHHAAVRSEYQMAGLMVLHQLARFIGDCHRLHSMNMDYVFCYYRPDNKFPAHVFGGAARHINDPKLCSTDLMAYYHHSKAVAPELPKNWLLEPVDKEDLRDLANFYEQQSGGLMLEGLHLEPDSMACPEVTSAYLAAGLKRDRQVFALRHKDRLRAVFMANHADLGLNMSDLTNSITILVVNEDSLTKELLLAATNIMARFYDETDIPILLFPQQTAARLEFDSEKSYCIWIYHTRNLDPYFRFLKRYMKFVRH